MTNKKNPNVRSKFNLPERNPKKIEGKTLTQQHMKEETDINTIVNRYLKNPSLGLGNPDRQKRAIFADFSSAADFQQMQDAIIDAEHAFSDLPSRIRGKFKNDPYQLLRWLEDPENQDEAIRLGLLPEPETPFVPDEPATSSNPPKTPETQQTDLVAEAAKNPSKTPSK